MMEPWWSGPSVPETPTTPDEPSNSGRSPARSVARTRSRSPQSGPREAVERSDAPWPRLQTQSSCLARSRSRPSLGPCPQVVGSDSRRATSLPTLGVSFPASRPSLARFGALPSQPIHSRSISRTPAHRSSAEGFVSFSPTTPERRSGLSIRLDPLPRLVRVPHRRAHRRRAPERSRSLRRFVQQLLHGQQGHWPTKCQVSRDPDRLLQDMLARNNSVHQPPRSAPRPSEPSGPSATARALAGRQPGVPGPARSGPEPDPSSRPGIQSAPSPPSPPCRQPEPAQPPLPERLPPGP